MITARDLSIRVVALAIGCVFAIVVAEIVLRVFSPFDLRLRSGRIVLPTNVRYEIDIDHPDLDTKVIVTKNELGFRGPPAPAKGDGSIRIISIGGSTTENLSLSEGQTWTDHLANHLEHNFEAVWANNAGLDGHSTYGHLVLLQDYVLQLKPDIAIFLVGVNDVGNDAATTYDRDAQAHGLDFSSVKQLLRTAARYSDLFALGLNLYRSYLSFAAGISRNLDDESANGVYISDEGDDAIHNRLAGPYLADFEARLRQLIYLCRSSGIEPVLVTQPTLFGLATDPVDGRDLGTVKGLWNLDGNHTWIIMEQYNDVTRRIAKTEQLLLVDLATQMPKSRKHFVDGIHFTRTGTKEVAKIIYQTLCLRMSNNYPDRLIRTCSDITAVNLAPRSQSLPRLMRSFSV